MNRLLTLDCEPIWFGPTCHCKAILRSSVGSPLFLSRQEGLNSDNKTPYRGHCVTEWFSEHGNDVNHMLWLCSHQISKQLNTYGRFGPNVFHPPSTVQKPRHTEAVLVAQYLTKTLLMLHLINWDGHFKQTDYCNNHFLFFLICPPHPVLVDLKHTSFTRQCLHNSLWLFIFLLFVQKHLTLSHESFTSLPPGRWGGFHQVGHLLAYRPGLTTITTAVVNEQGAVGNCTAERP